MVDVNKLINQDLIIAENIINSKNFDRTNVIGNRILQNLFIIREKKLMSVGYLVKEISLDLFHAQQIENTSGQKFDNLKRHAKKCIGEIKTIDFSKQDISMIWNPYFEFEIQTREFYLNEIEFKTYKTDSDFCKLASTNYLNMLIDKKSQLLNKNLKFVEKVNNEISLLFNITGNQNILLCYVFVRAVLMVYRYVLFSDAPDEELGMWVTTITEMISKITKLIEDENEEILIKSVLLNIGDLMWEYRNYYTIYGELSGNFAEQLPMPTQLVNKLRKTIQESYLDKDK